MLFKRRQSSHAGYKNGDRQGRQPIFTCRRVYVKSSRLRLGQLSQVGVTATAATTTLETPWCCCFPSPVPLGVHGEMTRENGHLINDIREVMLIIIKLFRHGRLQLNIHSFHHNCYTNLNTNVKKHKSEAEHTSTHNLDKDNDIEKVLLIMK